MRQIIQTGFNARIPSHVKDCMTALETAGFEVFLVGGSVRDFLMGTNPLDFDLTTDATPDQVLDVFSGYKTVAAGLKHGTVTVIIRGDAVEITTFRIEGEYSDSRRPDSVTFSGSLEEDVLRRDFTINSLAMDSDGRVVDYTGGIDDIQNGIIRAVGDPNRRFGEDALRIMRALRFASVLGFSIEENTGNRLIDHRDLLHNIATERVWHELSGLVCGKDVRRVMDDYFDVFALIIPEIVPMRYFDQHSPYHRFDVWQHTIRVMENTPPVLPLRLAALFHDIGKPSTFTRGPDGVGHFYGHETVGSLTAGEVLSRLKCDSKTRATVISLVSLHCVPIDPDEKMIKRRLNQHGNVLVEQLLELKLADVSAQAETLAYRKDVVRETMKMTAEIIEKGECFSLSDLAVNGNDLASLGMKPGKEVGKLLDILLEKVLQKEIANEKEALILFAAKQLEASHEKKSNNPVEL